MSFGTALVAIVAIVAFAVMRIVRYNTASSDTPARLPGDDAEKIRLRSEFEDLRERVKVLERIATDGGEAKRIASEIESLRDN